MDKIVKMLTKIINIEILGYRGKNNAFRKKGKKGKKELFEGF